MRLTSVNWVESVDRYLDHLVETVPSEHGRTSRTRLLAALVTTTPADAGHLSQLLEQFEATNLTELPTSQRPHPRLGRPSVSGR